MSKSSIEAGLAYRRVLLKISGEALMGEQNYGIDVDVARAVAEELKAVHQMGVQVAVVVGGGNSAAEAALDLWRAGARVTLVHFGPTFDKKIKPWVLPDFTNRVAEGSIRAVWNSRVREIVGEEVVVHSTDGTSSRLHADHVFLMTGFAPSVDLLKQIGVQIDSFTGIPSHDPTTLETNVPGIFIAGVVTAGYDANKVFIENGRFHGDQIVARLLGKPAPPPAKISRELDS